MSTFSKREILDGEFWKLKKRLLILSKIMEELLKSNLRAMGKKAVVFRCPQSSRLPGCRVSLAFGPFAGVLSLGYPPPFFARYWLCLGPLVSVSVSPQQETFPDHSFSCRSLLFLSFIATISI